MSIAVKQPAAASVSVGRTAVFGGRGGEARDDSGGHQERVDCGKPAVHELLGLDLRAVRQPPQGGVDDQAGGELAPGEQSRQQERGVAERDPSLTRRSRRGP